MCGIAGYVGNSTREELERMMVAIRHRGPDDSGILVRENVGLGHQRLAIIDVSPRGHQPMVLPQEDIVIVFNGEIYNFKELREDLKRGGANFSSDSDTEVLLHLYARDGEDFLRNVVGMFAIALYDFKKHKLVLARDRFGEKPLYWTEVGGVFRFASELRGLLAANIQTRVDSFALQQYLQCDYVPTPRTILSDIYKLEPASLLVYEDGQIRKQCFWKPPEEQTISAGEARSKLDTLLAQSVERQLLSDVPLGVFLSGGIDSSTIAYYAARASSQRINTFSIGFEDPSFDESVYARAAARHIGTNHHELVMRESDALSLIEDVSEVFSEPVADASVIPTMFLSNFARQSVTVALGGDGGDELFAGYPTFKADPLFRVFQHVPASLREVIASAATHVPVSHANFHWTYNLRKFLSSDASHATERHIEWLGTFNEEARNELVGKVVDVATELASYGNDISGSPENKLLFTYMRTYLMDQVLVKVDRASMHYALETRAPLLDHTLVDCVLSLPFQYKYKRGTGKYLLKKVMENKLPHELVHRKKKGFGIPLARWLTGPLRPLCEELLSRAALNKHGFFDETYVDILVRGHMEGYRDNRKELWNLMVFQMWYKRWMR